MSQIRKEVEEEVTVTLELRVKIRSFSNHDGYFEGQVEKAVEEFKEEIKKELLYRVCTNSHSEEFLQTVDFVSYDVEPEELKEGKYYFITYRGMSRDSDSSLSIWNTVTDLSPMAFIKKLLVSESEARNSYYKDFVIMNTEEISKEEYLEYKGKF